MLVVTGLLLVGAVGAALWVALWTARRRLVEVTVRGASMVPALRDGDRVMVRRVVGAAVRRGQIVVLEHPDPDGQYRTPSGPDGRAGRTGMIKRCTATAGDPVPAGLPERCRTVDGRVPPGVLTVLSDNPSHPNDSRVFGFLPHDRVLGVVVHDRDSSAAPARSASSR